MSFFLNENNLKSDGTVDGSGPIELLLIKSNLEPALASCSYCDCAIGLTR